MEVAGVGVIDDAIRRHPDVHAALLTWLEAARAAEWRSLLDVRSQFPTADGVALRKRGKVVVVVTVFNIGGNKYRLITLIDYRRQLVTVTHVLTHAEYDKEKWKRQLGG